MSDDRTPQQRAADSALDEAIRACVHAYESIPPGAVLARWMVIGTGIGTTDDAADTTIGFYLLPGEGHVDWHAMLGMLRATALRCEHDYATGAESWDDQP